MRSLIGGVLAAARPRSSSPQYTSGRNGALLGTLGASTVDAAGAMGAMGANGTLFAIVNRTSNATAQLRWHLYRSARSGKPEDRTEVTSHAVLDLWRKPNAFMPGQEFVETFQQHLDLTGEAWWVIGRNPALDVPLELWPVRPDRMAPVPSATEFLAGYVYTSPSGEKVPLGLRDVIFLRMPNPLDVYRGMGPVQALLADLDSTRYSAEWNRNFFRNSAEPGGIVEVEERLSDDEFREMSQRWREQHQGVSNAHRVAILENNAKWVERKYTQRDMQFVELRDVSRAVIREGFGISKTMLGESEDVNRATAEAAEVVFARWLVTSRAERIKGALNNDLLPLYGSTTRGLEWDYESPVPEDSEAVNAERASKANAAKIYIDAGFSPASVAEALDIPAMEVPEGDGTDDVFDARAVAEMVQKVYLGVGTVLSRPEARTLLVAAGMQIDPDAPDPDVKPEPAPSPTETDPGTGETDPPADDDVPAFLDPQDVADWQRLRGRHAPLVHPVRGAAPDVDLTPVARAWDKALAALLRAWGPITARQRDALVAAVLAAFESGDLSALTTLSAPSAEAAAELAATMEALADTAAGQVVKEARDQGVDLEPATPDPDYLERTARVVAAALAAELAVSATREALRVSTPDAVPADVAASVREHLESLTDARPTVYLGAALTTAQNAGRLATMANGPQPAYYGNETLDGNTCKLCREIDGRYLGETVADVLRDYPAGGYARCEGRERCRGTVTCVWRPETTGGGT